MIFWGAERDIVQSFSFKKLIHRFLYQIEIISTYHLKEDDIKDYVIYINRYRPKTIVGYPSALYFMAKTIVDRALKLEHQAMGVITSGEMLYPHQRKLIEEVFKVKVNAIRTLITRGQKRAYVTLDPDSPAINIMTELGLM